MKILAVKTTQASELGTVATSNNRQLCHRQLQWAQSKPSQIAMDAINAIIVKCGKKKTVPTTHHRGYSKKT